MANSQLANPLNNLFSITKNTCFDVLLNLK